MAETEKIKVAQVDLTQSIKSVKDLRKAMKDLNDQFVAGKISEEDYRKQTEKLEQVMFGVTDAHRDAKLAVNDFGVQMKNVATIGKSVSAGFTAVQAGMNALCLESAGVAEQISKLQNLQALTQAFTAMKDSGAKAFKGLTTALKGATSGMSAFKKALIATGLGALVVILGTIIANWEEFTEALGISADVMTKVGDVFNGVINVITKSVGGLAKAMAKLIKGDFSGAWDEIKSGFDIASNYAQGVQDGIEKREEEARKKRAEEWEKERKALEDNLKQQLAMRESVEADGWKQSAEGKKYMDEYFKKRLSWYAKDSKEYKDILIEKNNYDKAYTNAQNAELEKQLEEQRKIRAEQNALDVKNLENIATILDRVAQAQNTAQQNELNALQDKYSQELELLNQYGIDTADLTNEYNAKVADINQKYRDAEAKAQEQAKAEQKALDEKALADHQQAVDQNIKGTASLASSATSILNSFADAQDTNSREGFENAKKVQTASATIQMLQGIATAISGAFTTKTGPWDIALAAAQSATIAAAGTAQIAKIKKTTYNGGGSSSTSVPSFNAATSLNDPSLTTRQLVSNSEANAMQADTKVYVTESDIKSTATKVDVMQSENAM